MSRASTGVLVLGGAAALWLFTRSSSLTPSVTTSETFDLPGDGGVTTYPAQIYAFAEAIAQAEGFYVPGSVPQRANNPGDLKLPNTQTIDGGITVFSSVEGGWAALYHQLWIITTGASGVYSLDMSIAEMARRWTATQPDAWAANVAAGVGADPSTSLQELLV